MFAASSLSAAFTDIGDAFMREHPATKVVFNFAASSELAAQIAEGSPAGVVATADLATMQTVLDVGVIDGEPEIFATNEAAIIVAPGNPLGISSIADLADDAVVVVQCAVEVPCGRYAAEVYENAGVSVTPKSFEENVKAVVAKVTMGEADAGIVYDTDVIAAGDAATGIAIPAAINVTAEYPIAVISGSARDDAARDFVDVVLSDAGRDILASYGFGSP